MSKLKKGIVFIDFEASGLVDSYPIEVAMINDEGYLYSAYIKPTNYWNKFLTWSEEAEGIHHIEKSKIMTEGLNVIEVAKEIQKAALKNEIYSDNGSFDNRWCDTLFEEAGIIKDFIISDIYYLQINRNFYFELKYIFFELMKLGVINNEYSFIDYIKNNQIEDIIENIENNKLIGKYKNNMKAHEALSDAIACKAVVKAIKYVN